MRSPPPSRPGLGIQLRRLAEVHRRYAETHVRRRFRGCAMAGDRRAEAGYVDRVELDGTRLIVEGWSLADEVALVGRTARVSSTPSHPREDVAVRRGCRTTVGFCLELPVYELPLTLETRNGSVTQRTSLRKVTAGAIRRAHLRTWPAFLLAAGRTGPATWRGAIAGDLHARARLKRALNIEPVTPAGVLRSDLWAEPQAIAQGEPSVIILPVFNAFEVLVEALERLERHSRSDWQLILIEDASTDARVRPFLRDWVAAREGRVRLLENAENLGFIRSVNRGFAEAQERSGHVLLLNSDALVSEDWDIRLLDALGSEADIATVTPMSNDAEILSVPAICMPNALHAGEADEMARQAAAFHAPAALAEMPTGVGFCMAMNRQFLKAIPAFDETFGRGYGEEVDWCQKARRRGGRHLGHGGVFVEHRGGHSFGQEAKSELVLRNNDLISQRYRTYDREVQEFIQQDPLLTPRLALAVALVAGRSHAVLPIYLGHTLGGGAEHDLQRRARADVQACGGAVVLRVGGAHRWRFELWHADGTICGATDDFATIEKLLEPVATRRVIYSCGVGDPAPLELPELLLSLAPREADRVEVLLHDFFPVSPSYCLLGSDGWYRGLDDLAADPAQAAGTAQGLADDAVWRAAWTPLLSRAERVVAFSESTQRLFSTAYPEAAARCEVRQHDLIEMPGVTRLRPGARPVIGALGNINLQKGIRVLQALGQNEQGIGVVVIGKTDPAFPLPRSVRVHGAYRISELPALVDRYGITHWLIPSIWPETFSFTTHEALATGLEVLGFDLGAQGDALARAPNGVVLPYHPSAEALAASVLDRLRADPDCAEHQ